MTVISTGNFTDVASMSYVIAKNKIYGSNLEKYLFDNIDKKWQNTFDNLKLLIKKNSLEVRILDKLEPFCNFSDKICTLKDDDNWYIYDSGHLTLNGAKYFGKFINESWFLK